MLKLKQLNRDKPVYSEQINGIPTGFRHVDEVIIGLAKSECGLLVGQSGCGKTAVISSIAISAARSGKKALYIALEEPHNNIINRWYANQFEISYTDLHYGKPGIDLVLNEAFKNLEENDKRVLKENLDIIDARRLTPITTDQIKTLIENKAKQGFIPDIVLIDQMDYMRPVKTPTKSAAKWENYEEIAFNCDMLSQYKILDKHNFALWVVHQAKGEPMWTYGFDTISGFKGIVKPFDVAFGVGRPNRDTPYVNIFSLKVRHTQHVKRSYRADFQYMRFTDAGNWHPESLESAKKKKTSKGIRV
jgi:energy-coupling factor transporter ATP-binding protein EcfA2